MDPKRGKHVRGPPAPTRGNFRVPRRLDTPQYQPQQVDPSQYYISDPPLTTQPQQVDRSQYYISDPPLTTQPQQVDRSQYYIPDPPPTTQPQYHYSSQSHTTYFPPPPRAMHHPPPRVMNPPPATRVRDYEWYQTAEIDLESFNPFDRTTNPPPPTHSRAPTPLPTDDEDEAIPDTQEVQIVEEVVPKRKYTRRADKKKWIQEEEVALSSVRLSGCDDINVMTETLKDYKTRTGKEFTSIAAWKRKKSSEEGNYESSSNNDDATVLPDLNESSTPSSRPRKGRKNVGSSSSKGGGFFPAFTEKYAEKKKQNVEKANMKKQALLDLQLKHQSNKTKRSDYKFFNTPHANSDPKSREWAIEQKREIAAKYGWEFNE
uniref:proline-rich receptor-like protein kinase PERK8 n=1 Tax=Erigeron canadensis TaxID=72917 RepID=UPI001CB9BB86|nr:proline-rich receptor-like protein kinase PERK8 [Erigeron canadensis]